MSAEFEEQVLKLVEANVAADARHSRRLEEVAESLKECFKELSKFIEGTQERLDELEAWRERGY